MRIDPGRKRSRSISLTPLIDVVFLLLVFFMLASTFLKYSGLDLAAAKTGATATAHGTVIVLKVLGEGRLELDGAETPADGLEAALAAAATGADDATVAIQPGEAATVQDIATAVETARRAPVASVVVVR
ncbi:MAG TPA: biopolymer transporter ExbD [Kaistiaceae bacterium]|mgnify:CR=1 FL=1|nr:biopolymer transporter ExbD [Kaistiaceae bacterium]